MGEARLFDDLPTFDLPLAQDELRMLSSLPNYWPDECVIEIDAKDQAVVRRLARKGLVRVKSWKDDPISTRTTMYAGRTAITIALEGAHHDRCT